MTKILKAKNSQIFLKGLEGKCLSAASQYLDGRNEIGKKAISDDYSTGWIFWSRFDAVKRLELHFQKELEKAESAMEKAADIKVRLDALKGEK